MGADRRGSAPPAEEAPLRLRPAGRADAPLLYAWRNDPETRLASHATDPIAWSDHVAWLGASLASPDRRLRIAEVDGEPVGVVRAARSSDGWELSWTVAPRARSRGIGRRMLRAFVESLDGPLCATIRRDNAASAKIAAAAGFVRVGDAEASGFDRWHRG